MKRLIPLLLAVLVLSACKIRLDVTVEVNEDESGNVSLVFALDDELRDLAAQSGNDQFSFEENVPADWTTSTYVDGVYEGIEASTSFTSIEAFRSELQALADSELDSAGPDFLSQLEVTRDGDLFNFSADLTGLEAGLGSALAGAGDANAPGLDSAFLNELVDIRLVLTMPGEVLSSNADATAANTLTWNLSLADDGKLLSAQSSVAGGSGLNPAIPVLILVALVIVGVVIIRRRSARAEEMSEAAL